jgi:hypothetical protein
MPVTLDAGGQTSLVLSPPPGGEESVLVYSCLSGGPSLPGGPGPVLDERVLEVTLPGPSRGDLLVSVDREENRGTRTVLAVRARCGDPTSEVPVDPPAEVDGARPACESPALTPEGLSLPRLEARGLSAGSYSVLVQRGLGSDPLTDTSPLTVDIRVRPVREPGEPCDPAGLADRCGGRDALCSAGICTQVAPVCATCSQVLLRKGGEVPHEVCTANGPPSSETLLMEAGFCICTGPCFETGCARTCIEAIFDQDCADCLGSDCSTELGACFADR